jgi:hypothetical protein
MAKREQMMKRVVFVWCVVLLGAVAPGAVWAQKGTQSCKLQSEKVVQGRERQCIYQCPDKSLEGRTRKVDSDCPKYIDSAKR